MGLIRKSLSVSTLGGVKYTSEREARTKAHIASARLANAQARQVAGDPVAPPREPAARADGWEPTVRADKWEAIVADFEAGETVWADLTRWNKMNMPVRYQLRCKAAERRRGADGQA